jgi:hypothetical protein
MTDTYRVFRRKVYKRVPSPWGRSFAVTFRPHHGRRFHVRGGLTIEEARTLCDSGPANMARDAGREYRHLAFYEFERE